MIHVKSRQKRHFSSKTKVSPCQVSPPAVTAISFTQQHHCASLQCGLKIFNGLEL